MKDKMKHSTSGMDAQQKLLASSGHGAGPKSKGGKMHKPKGRKLKGSKTC